MDKILDCILKFTKDRDWDQFHNPKDLAISVSLEASELLECFQWKEKNDIHLNQEKIGEEIADVYIYLLLLCEKLHLDLDEITYKKIQKNAVHYPVEKCRGNSKKYTNL